MAPLYWVVMIVLVWVMLVGACALVWWMLKGVVYHFKYKL